METVYIAGGCLWGVQAFFKTLPGVIDTEAGRANGESPTLEGPYDGYAECVKVIYNPEIVSINDLMHYLFEIIDPYSVNKQGQDEGLKYRTGLYSTEQAHLEEARAFISSRDDASQIAIEIKLLTNYITSAPEHQDRLTKYPNDYCHIPRALLKKYQS
ncbi:peptide-methionine (S)-S-oxide reductase [Mammaliicoccus lentus]|uniref:peptide-methionine (S)-S-oxide reductase n=1 Tax=Mammaliicoccus lentus TaxID=42858 RepID=UPI003A598A59